MEAPAIAQQATEAQAVDPGNLGRWPGWLRRRSLFSLLKGSDWQNMGMSNSDVWWGLGMSVESQWVIGGITMTVAWMQPLDESQPGCAIKIQGFQVGPGLGGGGDVTLLIASGIVNPGSFPMIEMGNEWNVQLRVVDSISNVVKDGIDGTKEIARSTQNLIRLIKTVPMKDILNFSLKHPRYVLSLRPAVEGFIDLVDLGRKGYDIAMKKPNLWTLPTLGGGAEVSAAYGFHNRVSLYWSL